MLKIKKKNTNPNFLFQKILLVISLQLEAEVCFVSERMSSMLEALGSISSTGGKSL